MTTTNQRKYVIHGILGFFLAAALFSGCGGEKKGQKEYEEGMNFYTVQQYESAVKQFAAAANLGHAEAQNQLGLCFAKGEGVKQDDAEAIKWFRKAAEQGFAESQYILGCAYYSGKGGLPIDLEEAAEWLGKAAKQGNTDAQELYDSMKKIVELFGPAKKGDTDAMFELGVFFYNGDGVKENKTEAVKWFKKAAEKGDATAMYNLFVCYANGYGVEQDMQEAIRWCIKAGDHGDAKAYYMVGMTYFLGKDIQIDLSEAIKWLSKAVECGYPEALEAEVDLSLGWVKQTLEKAQNGDFQAMLALSTQYKKRSITLFPTNSRESDKWMNKIKMAASLRNAKAMYVLGNSYGYGSYEGKELHREAIKIWKKEWEKYLDKGISTVECGEAALYLGYCYDYGKGVDKDAAEAVKWYDEARDMYGDVVPIATYMLGLNFKYGTGVDKDADKAVKLFKIAAEEDHAGAMSSLGGAYMNGEGVDKDAAEAVKWFKKAAEKGYSPAMYELGKYYETNKDLKEARKWYRQAAVFGSSEAKDKLKELDGK